jgi:polyketide biosynthesis enoyl-CoA hydratase PksH
MNYLCIALDTDHEVCRLRFNRPQAKNAINGRLVDECLHAIEVCEKTCKVLVIEGSKEFFCFGADFGAMRDGLVEGVGNEGVAERLYELWERIAWGAFTSIALVRGQANAGGMGFVAACDIVLADTTARFSLSEMLFGIYPACVLPFLIRRIGPARANYLTLITQPISVEQALSWGLVDAFDAHGDMLLSRYLPRLRRLAKESISEYKKYSRQLHDPLRQGRSAALLHNHDMHCRDGVMEGILRYVETSLFPWEKA